MKRFFALLAIIALPIAALAQDAVVPELTEIKDGIYMIKARGGNIGISVGADGVFMIDDQFAPLTPAILKTIRSVTDQPVKFVINTHWHGDHTGGNENLGKTGAIIIAHDNVYERMSTEQLRVLSGRTYPPSPKDALPIVTFNDKATFHMNGHTIKAMHAPHSHTDGDSIIFLKESNVVHMGDVFFQSGYPFLDVETGASIGGLLKSIDRVMKKVDDQTILIPGHGTLSDKAGLKEFRDVMTTVRDTVQSGLDAGKSLEDIQGEKPLAEYDKRWGSGFVGSDKILELVYLSLTDERFDYK